MKKIDTAYALLTVQFYMHVSFDMPAFTSFALLCMCIVYAVNFRVLKCVH